ncbi:MAG: zinc ribbon domain-containing protein, partial [Oscillospiraceae bacterium]|nr:zinc ribbon domain-containing protein [Oscillospiraceae bacterium]
MVLSYCQYYEGTRWGRSVERSNPDSAFLYAILILIYVDLRTGDRAIKTTTGTDDKYRRVIWQCNHKFKDKTRCKTPHLTEDEIKAAFVRMVNKLYADREFYITELA